MNAKLLETGEAYLEELLKIHSSDEQAAALNDFFDSIPEDAIQEFMRKRTGNIQALVLQEVQEAVANQEKYTGDSFSRYKFRATVDKREKVIVDSMPFTFEVVKYAITATTRRNRLEDLEEKVQKLHVVADASNFEDAKEALAASSVTRRKISKDEAIKVLEDALVKLEDEQAYHRSKAIKAINICEMMLGLNQRNNIITFGAIEIGLLALLCGMTRQGHTILCQLGISNGTKHAKDQLRATVLHHEDANLVLPRD